MSKGKQIREWGKNLLIALLLCSAAWLLADSQLFGHLPWQTDRQQTQTTQQTPAPAAGQVAMPLAVAVTTPDGVCAARYDEQAVGQMFQPLLPVLGEAMAGAGKPEPAQISQWRSALTAPGSAWFELQGSVPMQVLCRWMAGVENPVLTGNARQLLLCVEQGRVRLYYRQDAQTCHVCTVEAMLPDSLKLVLEPMEPNGAGFAAGHPEYQALNPDTLILAQVLPAEEYLAYNPLEEEEDLDRLLEALAFTPAITTVYQTPEGRRARSGNDTLTISDEGLLSYDQSETEQRYPLTGTETDQEEYRAVDTARQLVCRVTQHWGGTQVYLRDVRREGDGWRVEFGYVLNAIPVEQGTNGWCASVLVGAEGVQQYELSLRAYAPTGKTNLVLPQPQAAAALEQMGLAGNGLVLSYMDGGDLVRAGWTAEP